MTRAVVVALSLLALAGCGSPAPRVPTAAPPTAQPAPAPTAAENAFVTQARKIAPRIVGSDERLAVRAANTCTSLGDGRSHTAVVDQAVDRFSSGSYSVTRAEAEQLVEAARTTVCSD